VGFSGDNATAIFLFCFGLPLFHHQLVGSFGVALGIIAVAVIDLGRFNVLKFVLCAAASGQL
jgi:hypothetical protein